MRKKTQKILATTIVTSLLFASTVCAADVQSNESVQMDEQMQEESGQMDEQMQEESGQMDARTQNVYEEYTDWLNQAKTLDAGTYSEELAKFPTSYQTQLKKLHEEHPNWVFVAVKTGLSWDTVITEESVSGTSSGTNRSLLPNSSGSLLLSKASTDYNPSTGKYIAKDGSTWVSASKPAVAYYVDPRNFLNDNYIFMFEALDYNEDYHKLSGVSKILKGTDLYKKEISYLTTSGKTISTDMTYAKAIYAAGGVNKVSPLFLAAKIRQETGAKLTNGSISGNYSYGGKSYRGYYNFYNIGAYSTSTGSAVANGLVYAKGGSSGAKTYKRPWTSPLLAIDGGAEFLAKSYISKGQNTGYFQRFNTVYAPYYQHQYMQNLTAAASEAKTTYNSYKEMGILNDSFVFYIPVYESMPSQTATIKITKSVTTGKTTTSVNMRKGPSASTDSLVKVEKGKQVKVSGAVYTDATSSVSSQQSNPYWYKVTYGGKEGYISSEYIVMDTDSKITVGGTKQLTVTCSQTGKKIYYETSNPSVASVSAAGKVTGKKKGTCTIYAVTSSGKKMDAIGISVTDAATQKLSKPQLVSVANSKEGVVIRWKKVAGATGYYIYRKTPDGTYKKIKTLSSGSTVKYTDTTMKSGTKYVYTVGAYTKTQKSAYDKEGLTIRRLSNPNVLSAKSTKNGIQVKWEKVRSAVTYEIFRKESGGAFKKISEVQNSSLSYTDKTAKKGVTYYYTVGARSGVYRSAYNEPGKKAKR